MGFFNFDLKKIIFLLLLLALPLLSVNMEQKGSQSSWFDQPFRWVAHSTQDAFVFFTLDVKNTVGFYLNLLNIKKMNTALSQENFELRAQQTRMNELLLENHRLSQLLEFREKTKMDLVAAQVIGRDLIADHKTITINKGLRDGIKAGQAVITIDGAVGYIFRPTESMSHVMLLTDRYAVIDGVVQRSRAQGIIEGLGGNDCSLKYVERTEDVKEGDLVVTGGIDQIFPKGLPAAVVRSVERKTFSVSLKVELTPIIDPDKLEEVFIVKDSKQVDLKPVEVTKE